MKKKLLQKIYTAALFLSGTGLVLIVTLFLFMQTEIFRKHLKTILVEEARQKGITLVIDELKGIAPFKWSFDSAEALWDGNQLKAEKVKFRIAFFPLLKKELLFSSFEGKKIEVFFSTPSKELELPPFYPSVKFLKIKELHLHDLSNKTHFGLKIEGKSLIRSKLKEIHINLFMNELERDNTLYIDLKSSEKQNTLKGEVVAQISDSDTIQKFFDLPLKTTGTSSFGFNGPWSFWEKGKDSLDCNIKSSIDSFEIEKFPFLNESWSLDSKFVLFSDFSTSISLFSLKSNLFKFLGKGTITSKLEPITLSCSLSLFDTKPLSPLLPLELEGTLEAKFGLRPGIFLFSANSPSLRLGKEVFAPASFKIESTLDENQWRGKAFCLLENLTLPWQGSLDFFTEDDLVYLKDVSIETLKTKVSGAGLIDLITKSCQGSFFLLAEELKVFRPLFPDSDLEGRLGGQFSVKSNDSDLNITSNLLGKNIRYQSSLIDEIQIQSNVTGALHNPSGTCSLECENISLKGGEIAALNLSSWKSDEGKQLFTLTASGNWKQDFALAATGFIEHDGSSFTVGCESSKGLLFTHAFESPSFSFGRSKETVFLHNYQVKTAEGELSCEFNLSPLKADMEIKASHLPLDFFSLFYPNLSLKGSTSFEGAFRVENKPSGYFLLTLEDADFSSKIEKPIRAKGSLQVHFGEAFAQLHAYLYATENQFLDASLTLPLSYSYAPFSCKINKLSPLSGDIALQGAIEELFDFMQTGSQKASGWVTSKLFVSGNANSPYLHGEIELQKGAYENYISGTKVNDIEIQMAALGSFVALKELKASTKEGGKVSAKGTLYLKPENYFPYELKGQLENLTLMETKTLEASATGNVLLEGDLNQTKASGNLEVDKVSFVISDNLQSQIPSLPVTYINTPIHLQRARIAPPNEYPFKLDLAISGKDQIFIKGKGLNSQWHGDVILTGTPANPIAKGSLSLKKGEFKFSGKTFTLIQGDLSFADKAGQSSFLNISGQLQLSGVTIIATMQGPVTEPRLTFQSTPFLPTSSILSLILFNKDISEISPLQTLQLAQVIMSLSGSGGPDVLEAIRKSIGVDRLTIVGKDGSDEISLQIGWYLTHGITVSLSQSTTSSDVIIEVDLKNGFIFEAETQNQEEGKFSLKWNKNY